MSIWRRILSVIGLRPISAPRKYMVSESMQVTLTTLSQHDGRPEDDLIQDLLAAGLTHYYSSDVLSNQWETLSSRERDVAALVCLGYANKEIGRKLSISPQTVKTHFRNVLIKFNLRTRSELRLSLQGWDFSLWE
jgi:DNA-binding CsgD family transcriptional regulator